MAQPEAAGLGSTSALYYRHTLPVRFMHWLDVLCPAILFMSGLNIFNAFPALHWGKSSHTGTAPFLEIGAQALPSPGAGVSARCRSATRNRDRQCA